MKKIVCLFGAARSGTSITAHLLNDMGIYFGEDTDLIAGMDGINPDGFFERYDVSSLNEMLVKTLTNNNELYVLPNDWKEKTKKYKRQIGGIIDKMPDNTICGIKNNSMSVLFPVWEEVFKEKNIDVCYIHIVRHPSAVIKSTYKAWHLSEGSCLYTWYARNKSAMSALEYGQYMMVVYEELMEKPRYIIAKIADFLQTSVEVDKVASLIKPQLYHNKKMINNETQNILYDLLKKYGTAAEDNMDNTLGQLKKDFSAYEDMLLSDCNKDESTMRMVVTIKNGDNVVYSGAADWENDDFFSLHKAGMNAKIVSSIEIILATQAEGEKYGLTYDISMCKINGKDCQARVIKQPTIRDLNCKIIVDMEEKDLSTIDFIGDVKVRRYPLWYKIGRKIMPLRMRNFLRKIGVRKEY